MFISSITQLGNNQYEIEITVLQIDPLNAITDTILNYETAFVDTSNQLLFDITFFCADSSSNFKTVGSELHNYIYFPTNGVVTPIGENKLKFSLIELYPNPTNSNLMVSNLPLGENTITIITIGGKVLQHKKVTARDYELRLDKISSGLYFLRIENEVTTKKFIFNKE